MRILVTGISGFVGSHLARYAVANGDEVFALARRPASTSAPGVQVAVGNITDEAIVAETVAWSRPDRVFHLAAQSYPSVSWDAPAETFRTNVEGTLHVLKAVHQHAPKARVVVVSSSACYAPRHDGRPIREGDPTLPTTPYGVSKLAADQLTGVYAQRHGLLAMIARPFFLVGPGKIGDVSSEWAQRVVELEARGGGELAVGRLNVVRDFLDIRDGVAALQCIGEKGVPGSVYNISSGHGWALADYVQLFVNSSTSDVVVRASDDRAWDDAVKIGCPDRLKSLGWSARHSIEETVNDLLTFTRQAAKNTPSCK
jgi:GDP-4-dehydro-6-deoxy-D-mannose reductase